MVPTAPACLGHASSPSSEPPARKVALGSKSDQCCCLRLWAGALTGLALSGFSAETFTRGLGIGDRCREGTEPAGGALSPGQEASERLSLPSPPQWPPHVAVLRGTRGTRTQQLVSFSGSSDTGPGA